MNSYTIVLVLLMSTCWMLTMLEVHHYQELTVNTLIEEAKKEHLLLGIENFVRIFALTKPERWVDHVAYPVEDRLVMITMACDDGKMELAITYNNKIYEKTISV